MKRNLEVLISSHEKDPYKLASGMNLECDAVIVNQGNKDGCYEFRTDRAFNVKLLESSERGVGKSRNHALDLADSKIVLFSDDDIVYSEGYAERVLAAFSENKDADVIMFNVNVREERKTYHINKKLKVHKWSVGRYPAYAAAAKLESISSSGLRFSTLFGGGAKYSNGEDSLFFMDCLRTGLIIKAVPVLIGTEKPHESTWFHGFNEKFFRDRGVLYHFLYGKTALLWALRFVLAKKKTYGKDIKPSAAFRLMREGIKEGKFINND